MIFKGLLLVQFFFIFLFSNTKTPFQFWFWVTFGFGFKFLKIQKNHLIFLIKKLQESLEIFEYNPENQKNRNNQKDKLARFFYFQT